MDREVLTAAGQSVFGFIVSQETGFTRKQRFSSFPAPQPDFDFLEKIWCFSILKEETELTQSELTAPDKFSSRLVPAAVVTVRIRLLQIRSLCDVQEIKSKNTLLMSREKGSREKRQTL